LAAIGAPDRRARRPDCACARDRRAWPALLWRLPSIPGLAVIELPDLASWIGRPGSAAGPVNFLRLQPVRMRSATKKEMAMRASVYCRRSLHRFTISLWDSLGSCPRCIRDAFRAAFISWVLAGVGQAIPMTSQFLTLSKTAACTLTALWLAHLLAHALKVTIAARPEEKASAGQGSVSRRSMIPIFARALMAVAVATSIPTVVLAQCSEEAAARCQAAASNCRAKCDRAFHREDANHACHQECDANRVACKSDARCT
jgi:hypothetical protein